MQRQVTTYFLDMNHPGRLRPKPAPLGGLALSRVEHPTPELNHFFFVNVGRPWRWYSRLAWSYAEWSGYVQRPGVHTWLGYLDGSPLGYAELVEKQGQVELAFFGMLPGFLSKGLGGWFLSEALKCAWRLNPQRVWVHTCSLDHKYAVANYQARGFRLYDEKTEVETIPDDDDPIWCTPAFYTSLTREHAGLTRQMLKPYEPKE
jgi:GNAT superfamily N-acetyltransferase